MAEVEGKEVMSEVEGRGVEMAEAERRETEMAEAEAREVEMAEVGSLGETKAGYSHPLQ